MLKLKKKKTVLRAGDSLRGPSSERTQHIQPRCQESMVSKSGKWKMVAHQAQGFKYVARGRCKFWVESQMILGYSRNFIQARTSKNEDSLKEGEPKS